MDIPRFTPWTGVCFNFSAAGAAILTNVITGPYHMKPWVAGLSGPSCGW